MGVMNLKWLDAMRRAGYAFSETEKKEGWPDSMDPGKLAALQRPAYYTLIKRMMEHDPFDPVALAQIEQTSANRSLHEILQHEFNAGRGPNTREKFTVFLLTHGVAPSVDSQAWFDAVGVVEPSATIAANTPNESLSERNLRWLEYYEREVATGGKRGAYNRSAATFDEESSTFRKAVDKARNERAERYRADIKAGPRKDVPRPFDGLITAVKDGKKVNPK